MDEISQSGPRKWLVVIILGLALSIIIIDTTIVNVSLPSIQKDFGISVVALEWISATYALVFGAFILIWGRLGDQFGRRKIFAVGVVTFVVGSTVTGFSPNLSVMLIGRIVQGFGAAMASPSTLSILTTSYRGKAQRIAFGVWGAIAGASGALGPLVGGYLTTNASWRWAFLINVPIGIVALSGCYLIIRESRSKEEETGRDLVGAILVAAGLGPMIFGLVEGQTYGWITPSQPLSLGGFNWPLTSVSITPFAMGVGLVLASAFLAYEIRRLKRHQTVLFDFSLLSKFKGFRYGLATVTIVAMGEFGVLFILSIYLQVVRGLTAFGAGITFLPFAGVSFVTAPTAGVLSAKFGPKRIVTLGMVFEAISLLMLSRIISVDVPILQLEAVLILYGAGVGLAIGQLTGTVLSSIPRERAGMGSGATNTVRQLGSAFGIAIIGAVLTAQVVATGTTVLAASTQIPESLKPLIQSALNQGLSGGVVALPGVSGGPIANAIASVFFQAITEGTRSAALVAGIFVSLGAASSLLIPNVKIFDQPNYGPKQDLKMGEG